MLCFQSGVLQKLTTHSSTLQDVLVQLCDLVQRETFTQSLFSLGLLDPAQYGGSTAENNHTGKGHTHSTPKQHGYKVRFERNSSDNISET